MTGPQCALLPDGKRLHLHFGPIDLILFAQGPANEVARAYWQACAAFEPVLHELVRELPLLRRPLEPVNGNERAAIPTGIVARRMWVAVQPHRATFVTPMAAVAGAVADYVLAQMCAGVSLQRAYVNNGGDIALFLAPAQQYRAAIAVNPVQPASGGVLNIEASDGVRGIATSGWQGRSHSLGIADAVTVLAQDAARADVAATLIANRVDLPGSKKISRRPACELQPDSDLGERLVTTAVAPLTPDEIDQALRNGIGQADEIIDRSLAHCVVINLHGRVVVRGDKGSVMLAAANTNSIPAELVAEVGA